MTFALHIKKSGFRNKQLRAHIMSEANEMKNSEGSMSHLMDESTAVNIYLVVTATGFDLRLSHTQPTHPLFLAQ